MPRQRPSFKSLHSLLSGRKFKRNFNLYKKDVRANTAMMHREKDKKMVNNKQIENIYLSSLRAESARAFTGRLCPHTGKEEYFLTGQPNFFTETAVTPERKVEKSFPMWEINRHAEG